MKSYTEQERQEHLENWERGALTKAAYAESVGIKKETFYYWLKCKAKSGNQDFIEIKKRIFPTTTQGIVIEKGSITIRVPLSIDTKELRTVFAALENVS